MSTAASILIVEDEPHLREVCQIVLSAEGYTVTTATNGSEGLIALRATKPDLVLLDLYMPGMNGREFLYNFNEAEYPNTKIVVYSNASEKDIESQMKALGASEVALKSSLSPKELVALVRRVLHTAS